MYSLVGAGNGGGQGQQYGRGRCESSSSRKTAREVFYGYKATPSDDPREDVPQNPTQDAYQHARLDSGDSTDDLQGEKRAQNRLHLATVHESYRPAPLRSPFIVAVILLLMSAIACVVYAHLSMPNSQSTAVIHSKLRVREAVVIPQKDVVAGARNQQEKHQQPPTVVVPSINYRPIQGRGFNDSDSASVGPSTPPPSSFPDTPSSSTPDTSPSPSVPDSTSPESTPPESTPPSSLPLSAPPSSTPTVSGPSVSNSPSTAPSSPLPSSTPPPDSSSIPSGSPSKTPTSFHSASISTISGSTESTDLSTEGLISVTTITTSGPITFTPTEPTTIVSTGVTTYNSTFTVSVETSVVPASSEVTSFVSTIVDTSTSTLESVTGTETTVSMSDSVPVTITKTLYTTTESVVLETSTTTGVFYSVQPPGETKGSTVVSQVTSQFTTTQTQTAGNPFIVYGPVTITSTYTVGGSGGNSGGNSNSNNNNAGDGKGGQQGDGANSGSGNSENGNGNGDNGGDDNPAPPVTEVFTTIIGGQATTIVQGGGPQTVVSTIGPGLQTITNPGQLDTIVTNVGGTPTAPTVVVTPTPTSTLWAGDSVLVPQVQTLEDGSEVTLCMSTSIVAATNGGIGLTLYAPISITATISTTGADGSPSVSSTVIVTTPTDALPITMTLKDAVSTIGGSLVTITRTGSAKVETTSVTSGRLTTLTTSRSRSTLTSTMPSSTVVSTTVKSASPTATSVDRPKVVVSTKVLDLEPGTYFVATFLPTVVAVILSLPLRIIDLNAKMYQPFHAMSRRGGARGADSMTLDFSGPWGTFVAPFTGAAFPVPMVTTLLVALSSLLAPLATEALGLKMHGTCSVTDGQGCAGALGVSVVPAYALVSVLGLMVLLLAALLVLLRRWRTGVYANPWNIAGIVSLLGNPDVLRVGAAATSARKLDKALAERQFGLGFYQTLQGSEAYGIVLVDDASKSLRTGDSDSDNENSSRDSDSDSINTLDSGNETIPQPFLALTVYYRVLFFILLSALLALVLYYHIDFGGGRHVMDDKGLGAFVASNSFGVRFVMAALGVAVVFGWTALFLSVAAVAPFQAMAARPQNAEHSLLVSQRPTNEFSGLWAALRQRHVFWAVVCVMTMLAEFLPVLLVNVPYNVTQTSASSVVCARLVSGILGLMLLTLVASFVAVRWPAMPADPRTVAGSLYYVADAHSLPQLLASAQVAQLPREEKEARVRQLGRRYFYGQLTGRSGRRRLVLDADVSLADVAVSGSGSNPPVDVPSAGYGGGCGTNEQHSSVYSAQPPVGGTTAYQGGPFYVYQQGYSRLQGQPGHQGQDPQSF